MTELVEPGAMRAWSREQRRQGRRVALVPTMGYLHEGHLRLVDRARRDANLVVLSVFVNPTQFGPNEDFTRYPRDLDRDRALARSRGVDCLFTPTVQGMYPEPVAVRLSAGTLANHLCGPRRPGHFDGVLQVVAKLFHIVEPDLAVFGRKDAQQAAIIRRMARDLDFPVRVDVAPTVRESDGLALSSRNIFLSADDRRAAPGLSQALDAVHRAFVSGETDAVRLIDAGRAVLAGEPRVVVEYLEAVDPVGLAPLDTATADTVVALAARLGGTRLIDNIVLGQGIGGDDRLPAA